jgi:4-diphosphocytidyl-2-C-methyl-D-erythritol kinase
LLALTAGCATLEFRSGGAPPGARGHRGLPYRGTHRRAQRGRALFRRHRLAPRRASDEIVVSGPLGQGLARLTSGGGAALLETADQKRYMAADLEGLSEQVFGTRLPVAGLGRWVLGRSASAARRGSMPAAGWPASPSRAGASSTCATRARRPRPCPSCCRRGAREVEVRLVIDRWAVSMTGWERRYPAPAKLNLFLHVVGRRPTATTCCNPLFRLIDRGDTLRFAPRTDGRICARGPLAGVPEESDLCLRAARLLQEASGCSLGVEITLDKRLPMGGGLGGGSSDAATVLLALNRLWRLTGRASACRRWACELGADVPFFIHGRNAFVEGVGERLQPVDLPPAWYLVVEPPVSVPTAEIFAAPNLTRDTKAIKMADFSAGWGAGGLFGRNDLEPVVCERYPEVARALAWLRQHAEARMTGSGACVFAPLPPSRTRAPCWRGCRRA